MTTMANMAATAAATKITREAQMVSQKVGKLEQKLVSPIILSPLFCRIVKVYVK